MKVTFFSNYLTQHQIPFCLAMERVTKNKFTFVATEPIDEERVQMGWKEENDYSFVLKAYESQEPRTCPILTIYIRIHRHL